MSRLDNSLIISLISHLFEHVFVLHVVLGPGDTAVIK